MNDSTKQFPHRKKFYDNIYGYSTLIPLLMLQNKFQHHRVSKQNFFYIKQDEKIFLSGYYEFNFGI